MSQEKQTLKTATLTRDELMAFIAGCPVEKWELEMEFTIKAPDVIAWRVIREVKE